MSKTVVILQSAYIPWKGYFHLMRAADLFVFHDDLQFTHSDWRTRNRIMTAAGPRWLTIPAGRDQKRRICDVQVTDDAWKRKHRRIIEQNYARASCFRRYRAVLDFLYDTPETNLSRYNQRAVVHLAQLLGVRTPILDSRALDPHGSKTERLIGMLTQLEATRYLSGPAGREYLDEALFREAGIELAYFTYPAYPVYPQRSAEFTHQVSVLDLLFEVGEQAADYIWGGM